VARVVVGSLHLLIAALLGVATFTWIAQILVNATWERAFYGEISILTSGATLATMIVGGFATLEATAALGWWAGRSFAGWTLVALSILLALVLPGPLQVLLVMSAASVAIELWARARAFDPPEPDEDD
jgi:hypothetical protein